jgi:hypothetical protein
MVENSICHCSLLKKTEYFKTTQIAELCPTIRGIVSSIFKESPQYQNNFSICFILLKTEGTSGIIRKTSEK